MSFLINRIDDRVNRQNKNFLMVLTGSTGSGKTYTAMRFAELIDPTFDISRVVFTQEQFMDLLKNGKLQKGNVIVWDEVGVNQSAKEWFETTNKLINFVIQTFRNKNLVVICTAPNFNFVDSSTRQLFHAYVSCSRDNKGNVYAKYYDIEVNDMLKKTYFKLPRFNGEKVKYILMEKPSQKLIDAYEPKATKYKDLVIMKADAGVQAVRKKEESKHLDSKTIASEVLKDYTRFMKPWGKRFRIDRHLIAAYFSIGDTISRRVKMIAENELQQKGLLTPKN